MTEEKKPQRIQNDPKGTSYKQAARYKDMAFQANRSFFIFLSFGGRAITKGKSSLNKTAKKNFGTS